jgi:hypothetical protein
MIAYDTRERKLAGIPSIYQQRDERDAGYILLLVLGMGQSVLYSKAAHWSHSSSMPAKHQVPFHTCSTTHA